MGSNLQSSFSCWISPYKLYSCNTLCKNALCIFNRSNEELRFLTFQMVKVKESVCNVKNHASGSTSLKELGLQLLIAKYALVFMQVSGAPQQMSFSMISFSFCLLHNHFIFTNEQKSAAKEQRSFSSPPKVYDMYV